MSKEIWRSMRVFNPHNLVQKYAEETGEKGVYIAFSSNDGSRMSLGTPHGYVVVRPGFYTDGLKKNKIFHAYRTNRDKAFSEAVSWTRERYGVGEFVAIPGFGRDRFPIEIAQWAEETLRRAKQDQNT